jgi:hypothetical protein
MNEAKRCDCPTCGAEYKVIRVETKPAEREGRLTCAKCGGPLNAREGRFMLEYFLLGASQRRPLRPRGRASAPPLVNPSGFPQHEVFENEISVATGKHRSARSTRHIAVNRFGSAFAFNDFVECLAVRACEGVTRHTTSPYTALSRPTHRIRTLLHARNVTRLSQPPTRLLKESPQSVGKLAGPHTTGPFSFELAAKSADRAPLCQVESRSHR